MGKTTITDIPRKVLSSKIISLYATGQSTSDIQAFLEENYGTEISREAITTSQTRYGQRLKAGAHALWNPSIQ